MKIFKFIFTFLLVLFISTSVFSQKKIREKTIGSLSSGTINSQFDYLYKKSYSYKDYKSVKKADLLKIKGNVIDSINALKKELKSTKQIIKSQDSEISNLKTNLKTTNDNLTSVTKEKDDIKFLGIPMTKIAYNSILWSIITALLVFLIFFILRFKSSNTITKQAKELLNDTEMEFEAYKAKALEREQKVRRELQDELNKQKYNSKKGKKD